MKNMNYKILIIKSGAVIVDLPENPKYEDISAVFADKAKQIRFKDENDVNLKLLLAMLLGDGDFLKVGQTFDLPDNLGVSFESCKMCEGTGQYEKPYQQFIKCNYCSNGKLSILTPITEAPIKSEGEDHLSKVAEWEKSWGYDEIKRLRDAIKEMMSHCDNQSEDKNFEMIWRIGYNATKTED